MCLIYQITAEQVKDKLKYDVCTSLTSSSHLSLIHSRYILHVQLALHCLDSA